MAGKKEQETAHGARGTKIVTDAPRDDSSLSVKKPYGRELGGSPTNLAHSISDCSVAPEQ